MMTNKIPNLLMVLLLTLLLPTELMAGSKGSKGSKAGHSKGSKHGIKHRVSTLESTVSSLSEWVDEFFANHDQRIADLEAVADEIIPGGNYVKTDFSGADLSGLDLTAANFTRANLEGALLNGSDLGYTNFSGANLRYAELGDSMIVHTIFDNSDIQNASFSGSTWVDVKLSKEGMTGVNFSGGDLTGLEIALKTNGSEPTVVDVDFSYTQMPFNVITTPNQCQPNTICFFSPFGSTGSVVMDNVSFLGATVTDSNGSLATSMRFIRLQDSMNITCPDGFVISPAIDDGGTVVIDAPSIEGNGSITGDLMLGSFVTIADGVIHNGALTSDPNSFNSIVIGAGATITGDITLTGDVTVTGDLTVEGDLTVNGTFDNASNSNIVVTGSLTFNADSSGGNTGSGSTGGGVVVTAGGLPQIGSTTVMNFIDGGVALNRSSLTLTGFTNHAIGLPPVATIFAGACYGHMEPAL